jgi:hypothetical protein
MKPYQRRFLAGCIFALAFILFFEARGQRLVGRWEENPPGTVVQGYWEHIGLGAVVVAIGAILILTLPLSESRLPIPKVELGVYALGLGLLIGTAVVSWTHVRAKLFEDRSDLRDVFDGTREGHELHAAGVVADFVRRGKNGATALATPQRNTQILTGDGWMVVRLEPELGCIADGL